MGTDTVKLDFAIFAPPDIIRYLLFFAMSIEISISLAAAAALGIAIYCCERLAHPLHVWPDSVRYLKMAIGQPVPAPFHRRWLLPLLCGTSLARWTLAQAASAAALAVLAAVANPAHPYLAAWFLLLVPAFAYAHGHGPILTDLPSLALAYAASLTTHEPIICVALSLLSGACKESGPVWAAVYSLSPWPLLGLAVVRWWGAAPATSPWHGNNYWGMFKHMLETARVDWRDPRILLSLGVLPVLALLAPPEGSTLAPVLAMVLGFGITLIATDKARLMGQAAPALLPLAMIAPPWALAVGAALHVLMPRSL